MSLRISFSDILYFTRNARKTPLIPEGFVLETPPECKATVIQLTPEPPTFCPTPPTISQSPVPSPTSFAPETPLGPVILIGDNSTETLVNIVSKSGSPTPILQLYPPASKVMQTRRISFADCPTPPRPVEPVNVIDVGQVPPKPSAVETPERAKPFRENVLKTEKKSKRKTIMSLLAPRTSSTKAHRFSVPVFSSVTDVMSKRASNRL